MGMGYLSQSILPYRNFGALLGTMAMFCSYNDSCKLGHEILQRKENRHPYLQCRALSPSRIKLGLDLTGRTWFITQRGKSPGFKG
jgi:hypothetical protein